MSFTSSLQFSGSGVRFLMVVCFIIICGCTRDSQQRDVVTQTSAATTPSSSATIATPQGHIDSILPIDEQLRRFRAGMDSVHTFTGGARSRDELVQHFIHAIEQSDTNALRRMLLARAEFAYLYYPVSPYTRPPYRQAPQLVWFQTEVASEQGIVRALRRLSGTPIRLAGYVCNQEPKHWGGMRVWEECRVRWRDTAGAVVQHKLFGAIAEYGGQFKFVSYENGY